MAEDAKTAPAPAPADGAAQPRTTIPPIKIVAQYVKDLSFENPNASKTLTTRQAPQVAVNVDVRPNPLEDNRFEVLLNIKGDAKIEDNQAFIVELSYGAIVEFDGEVKKEHQAPLLLIEAPRLMFPFARAVIAEAVRNGGFPPLLVQPIDFADLFRKQIQRLAAAQQASKATAGQA